jgi:hypothetical protein
VERAGNDFESATVWRAGRADATPVQLGDVSGLVLGMGIAGDAALVAVEGPITYAFPLDREAGAAAGSGRRTLATNADLTKGPASFVGIDGSGAFWSIPRPGDDQPDALNTLLLVPADGGPVRTLWNGSPSHSSVDSIAPDGSGGWIANVNQLFVEGFAASVYALDAHRNGRRLACSPLGLSTISGNPPIVAPDAVFVVGIPSDFMSEEIDRIPR